MSDLVLKNKRNIKPGRKPTGIAHIDKKHSLGRHVVLSHLDLHKMTTVGTDIDAGEIYGNHGKSTYYPVSNGYSETENNNRVTGNQPRSIIMILKKVGDSSSQGYFSLDDGAGYNADFSRWTITLSLGYLRVELQGIGYTSSILINSDLYAICVSYDGTTLAGHNFYVKNLETGLFEYDVATGTAAVNTSDDNIYVGTHYNKGIIRGASANIHAFYFLDCAITKEQFLDLANDPYSIVVKNSILQFSIALQADYTAELSAANFNLAGNDLQVSAQTDYTAEFTAAQFNYTGQSLDVITASDYTAELSTANFNLAGNDLQVSAQTDYTADLTAAQFNYTGQSLNITAGTDYIAELTAANFNLSGLDLDILAVTDYTATLSAGQLNYTGLDLQLISVGVFFKGNLRRFVEPNRGNKFREKHSVN